MDSELRKAKLQQALDHYHEAWDLVTDWSGAWPENREFPPGKTKVDWMVTMAMMAGIIQQVIDAEVSLGEEKLQ